MLLKVPREGFVRGGGRAALPGWPLGEAPVPTDGRASGLGAPAPGAKDPPAGRAGEAPGLAYCCVRSEGCTGVEMAGAKRPKRSSGVTQLAWPCARCSAAKPERQDMSTSESKLMAETWSAGVTTFENVPGSLHAESASHTI